MPVISEALFRELNERIAGLEGVIAYALYHMHHGFGEDAQQILLDCTECKSCLVEKDARIADLAADRDKWEKRAGSHAEKVDELEAAVRELKKRARELCRDCYGVEGLPTEESDEAEAEIAAIAARVLPEKGGEPLDPDKTIVSAADQRRLLEEFNWEGRERR